MERLYLYLFSGFLGVLNMICWGVYGDLQVERFSLAKGLRSVFLALVFSVYLYLINPALPLFVVALVVITFERFSTEIYKAFIRDERQGKYIIPSDWNLSWPRWFEELLGVSVVAIVMLLFWGINPSFNKLGVVLVAGFVAAIGGMAKDAPYEGFQLKFFRSPMVAIGVGIFVNYVFPSLGGKYYLFSVWGGERIVSECYKKILNGRLPGKFKKHKLNKSWRKTRKIVLVPYVIDIFLLLSLAFAI